METKILGYNIFNKSREELIDIIKLKNVDEKTHIISGNPEVLYNGLHNSDLYDNFTSKEAIIIPDGVGVVKSSRLVGKPVKEKIAGIDLMRDLLGVFEKENKTIYLLGATEEVLNECINNLKIKYENLIVIGKHNGFFDLDSCEDILNDIKEKEPYALFVAMGAPRQEFFVSKYMEKLPCTIFMGVGGSFDVIANKVKRAPKWMINLGLEWLYRVLKEPYRIKRLSSIPKFMLKVFFQTNIIKEKTK